MTLRHDEFAVLGEALAPPGGYQVESAFAATYSLDLPTALAIPLALIRRGELAGQEPTELSPWQLLEAVRQLEDTYRVVCDAACLRMSSRNWQFGRLLQQMVVPMVKRLPGGNHASFHPKFVLVRYRSDSGPPRMRLVCMSRNLSGSSALDIAAVIDGYHDLRPPKAQRSEQLANGLDQLPAMTARRDQRAGLRSVIGPLSEAVRRTRWDPPERFDDVAMWPIGFAQERANDPVSLESKCERMLVVAPFLGSTRLAKLVEAAPKGRHVLISNAEPLDGISGPALKLFREIYEFQSAAHLPAEDEEGGDRVTQRSLSGLHAKLYVSQAGTASRWILGSANATGMSVGGNVEMVVELRSRRREHTIDAVLGREIDDGMRPFLSEVTDLLDPEQESAEPEDRSAEKLIRAVAAAGLTGRVRSAEGDRYTMGISLDRTLGAAQPSAASLEIHPLFAAGQGFRSVALATNPIVVFDNLARSDLSHFVRLRATGVSGESLERVLNIGLTGIDEDALLEEWREEAVAAGGEPMDYIRQLIDGAEIIPEYVLDVGEGATPSDVEGENETEPTLPHGPLLEKLLRLARHASTSEGPGADQFEELARSIAAHERKLPDDFLQMWRAIYDSYRRRG